MNAKGSCRRTIDTWHGRDDVVGYRVARAAKPDLWSGTEFTRRYWAHLELCCGHLEDCEREARMFGFRELQWKIAGLGCEQLLLSRNGLRFPFRPGSYLAGRVALRDPVWLGDRRGLRLSAPASSQPESFPPGVIPISVGS